MHADEHPVVQIYNQMRRHTWVFPVCIILAIFSVFPLAYGIAEEKPFLSVPFGILIVASIGTLIFFLIQDRQLSNKMLEISADELSEMTDHLNEMTDRFQLLEGELPLFGHQEQEVPEMEMRYDLLNMTSPSELRH